MSKFIDYLVNPFSNLGNDEETIIEATVNSLWIQAINIVNTGEDDIRINLRFIRTEIDSTDIDSPVYTVMNNKFEAKNFLVPSYKNVKNGLFNTVNLVEAISITTNLQHSKIDNDKVTVDKLNIYSNGYTQKFDCSVVYSVLKELPSPFAI